MSWTTIDRGGSVVKIDNEKYPRNRYRIIRAGKSGEYEVLLRDDGRQIWSMLLSRDSLGANVNAGWHGMLEYANSQVPGIEAVVDEIMKWRP